MPRIELPGGADKYQELVEAFLRLGPRFAEVASQTGVSTYIAEQAWSKGFPSQELVPIANQFQKLVEQRRALVAARGRTALEGNDLPTPVDAIRNTAGEATYNEVDILAEFRKNILCALGLSNGILGQLDRLAQTVATRIADEVENAPFVSVETLLNPLERLGKATTGLAQATKTVFELQRLLQGAPTSITEHRTGFTGNQGVSPELQEKLVQAGQVIDMMRRHRGLLPPEEAKIIDADADSAYEGEEDHEPMSPAVPTPIQVEEKAAS